MSSEFQKVDIYRVNGLVDGVKVTSRDLLTLSGSQVMEGQMNITNTEGGSPIVYSMTREGIGVCRSFSCTE